MSTEDSTTELENRDIAGHSIIALFNCRSWRLVLSVKFGVDLAVLGEWFEINLQMQADLIG